jgi:uncharacterized protein
VPDSPVKVALLGIAAGLVSGLFGVGGGVVIVPGLVLWIGIDMYRAGSTSVATIVASSAAAVIAFAVSGEVDWAAAAAIFLGAGTGAYVGARYMTRIPAHWLRHAFVGVLLLAALRLGVG